MVEQKLRVGLIFGGRSAEHEVSLMSATSVLAALDPEKYEVTCIGVTHDGAWLVGENVLEAMKTGRAQGLHPAVLLHDPAQSELFCIRRHDSEQQLEMLTGLDVLFPLIHGTNGEDGTIQGLFELADRAYVGAGVVGSAVGMDKVIFKDVMRANGIPVVRSTLILRKDFEARPEAAIESAETLGPYPLFTKPVNLGSSVGISKCVSRSDLMEGLIEAARYDRRILVEEGIDAREIEVSVLGNEHPIASVPGEVLPSREFYSYESKYTDGTSGLLIPAPLEDEEVRQFQDYAVRAYEACDCAGLARVDFLMERRSRRIILNELNTIPGFTNISMYPKLWMASGFTYSGLVDRLIELALERKAQRDRTEHRFWRDG
jgi:D-alanine-D-alanine ligase